MDVVQGLILEWLSNSQEPPDGNDDHPQHGHGDRDAFDRMGYVGNNRKEPFTSPNLADKNIVQNEHEDQETVNNSQNCQILMKLAQNKV